MSKAIDGAQKRLDAILERQAAMASERDVLLAERDNIGGTDVDAIVGEIAARSMRADALTVALRNLQPDIEAARTALRDAQVSEAMDARETALQAQWAAIDAALEALDAATGAMDDAAAAERDVHAASRVIDPAHLSSGGQIGVLARDWSRQRDALVKWVAARRMA